MKIIDENGKIVGKVSILDIIVIAVLAVLVFFAILKFTNKDISEVSQGSEVKKVRYTVTCEGEKGIFESVKIGDRVGDKKAYLPCNVTGIEVEPLYYEINGEKVEDERREKAYIHYEGELPYQLMSFKLGKQEIRYGQKIFAESDCYRLDGIVSTIEFEDVSK